VDNELRTVLVFIGSVLLISIVSNLILLKTRKPYREFMDSLFWACNPDLARIHFTNQILIEYAKQTEAARRADVKRIMEETKCGHS
jgi:hypothetical protein